MFVVMYLWLVSMRWLGERVVVLDREEGGVRMSASNEEVKNNKGR